MRARDEMLRRSEYTRRDVWQQCRSNGVRIAETTVRAVIAGRFRNPDVERAFTELTGAPASVMFPLDEEPTGRAPVARKRMTRGLRERMRREHSQHE